MILANDLIEKILARATNLDECIVIVKDQTQANLRWANSTLTTNGVIQERNVTVLAFISAGDKMAAGGVTRTNVDAADIDVLVNDATAAAKAAGSNNPPVPADAIIKDETT